MRASVGWAGAWRVIVHCYRSFTSPGHPGLLRQQTVVTVMGWPGLATFEDSELPQTKPRPNPESTALQPGLGL
jgi:hypothetical protein